MRRNQVVLSHSNVKRFGSVAEAFFWAFSATEETEIA